MWAHCQPLVLSFLGLSMHSVYLILESTLIEGEGKAKKADNHLRFSCRETMFEHMCNIC